MSDVIKAISLWQPWASLWLSPSKIHETRHWSTAYRGKLLVHAARHLEDDVDPDLEGLLVLRFGDQWRKSLRYGAIVGLVDLVNVIPTDVLYCYDPPLMDEHVQDIICGNFGPGRFGWQRNTYWVFPQPIPYRGHQRLFNVPRAVVAAAAAAAMPASLLAAPAEAPPQVAAAPAEAARRGWWGYSTNGGEWFNGPFDSREEALAEAQGERPDCDTVTAWCIPYQLRVPDLREHCIEWIGGCGVDLNEGNLCWLFEGANSDYDYDGEVGDELSRANYNPLTADLLDACATALFRVGRPDLIPALYAKEWADTICDDEAVLDALGRDRQFETDCEEAGKRWIIAQGVIDAPRMLDTDDTQDHDAIEPEDGAAA